MAYPVEETGSLFILDTGQTIAKNALSPEKQEQLRGMIQPPPADATMTLNQPPAPTPEQELPLEPIPSGPAPSSVELTTETRGRTPAPKGPLVPEIADQRQRILDMEPQPVAMPDISQAPEMQLPPEPTMAKPTMPMFNDYADPESVEYLKLASARAQGKEGGPQVDARLQELHPKYMEDLREYQGAREAILPEMEKYDKVRQDWRQKAMQTIPGMRNEIARMDSDWMRMQNLQTQEMMNMFKQVQQEQKAIKEMKVDPNRLWSKSPGAMIMATIFAGLQYYGASISGRGDPSAGVKMINDVINRDIQMQQNAIGQRRQGISDMMSGMQMKMGIFKSKQAAINVHRANMMESVSQKMGELQQRTTNAMAAERLGVMRQQLDMQKEQAVLQGIKEENSERHRRKMEWMQRRTLKFNQDLAMLKTLKGQGKPPPAGLISKVGDLVDSLHSIDDLEGAWRKLNWHAPISGRMPVMTTDAKKYKSFSIVHTGKQTKAMYGGHASEADRERVEESMAQFGDSTQMGLEKIDAQRKIMMNSAQSTIDALRDAGYHDFADKQQQRLNEYLQGRTAPEGSNVYRR